MKSIKELINEARPAQLIQAFSGIIGKFFEKRIAITQTVDGMVGLYRGKDGNAYIVQISQARDSKYKGLFDKELSSK